MKDKQFRTLIATTPGPLSGVVAHWHKMIELLEAGQFTSAAGFLDRLQNEDPGAGQNHLKLLLAAAYQVCLARQQFQQEMDWRRMAYQNAHRGAENLKGKLDTLLSKIIRYQKPMMMAKEWAESG